MGHQLNEIVPGLLNLVAFLWIFDIIRAIFFGIAAFRKTPTDVCDKNYFLFCYFVFAAGTA